MVYNIKLLLSNIGYMEILTRDARSTTRWHPSPFFFLNKHFVVCTIIIILRFTILVFFLLFHYTYYVRSTRPINIVNVDILVFSSRIRILYSVIYVYAVIFLRIISIIYFITHTLYIIYTYVRVCYYYYFFLFSQNSDRS